MKKVFLTFAIGLLIQPVFAQISIGPKIGLGLGQIKSKNMQDNFEIQQQKDSDILTWDVSNRPGLFAGLGGFIQYDLNENIAFVAELTFNNLRSNTKIEFHENDLEAGSGDITTIESEAKINVSFFSLPILGKYSFSETGPYIIGGFRLNIGGTPKISSEETREREIYSNGMLMDRSIESRSISADLNSFGSTRLDFVLGGGTSMELNGKKLYLDLRYNHPLSRTDMYTTNPVFDDIAFKNNEVFTLWGKTDAELEVPTKRLDDFRMGFIELSASYTLFSK